MPDTARPFPVYPTAWLTDKELMRCSWGAQGMLIHLMVLSATGHTFGYVTDSKGAPLTITEICESKAAAMIRGRITKEETERYLKELLDEHRIEFDKRVKPGGAFYIPKMVRIGQARTTGRAYGRFGGNPALSHADGDREAWRRAYKEICDAIWTARESGSRESVGRAMRAARDKYKDVPKLNGSDVVTAAFGCALHNNRPK